MGAAFLAMMAYLAWRQFREYRAAAEYQAMADAAGLISMDAPTGTRLTADPREVCWNITQSAAACSDPGLTAMPRIRGNTVILDLVSTPRGLVLASRFDVTWLETSATSGALLRSPRRLSEVGAVALTALGTRVAWVSNKDVMVADLESERTWPPLLVGEVANPERPLLALSPDAVLYGPTENCALEWQESESCAVPREVRPCALASKPHAAGAGDEPRGALARRRCEVHARGLRPTWLSAGAERPLRICRGGGADHACRFRQRQTRDHLSG